MLEVPAQRHTIWGLCWLLLLLNLQRMQRSCPAIDDGCLHDRCFLSNVTKQGRKHYEKQVVYPHARVQRPSIP
jgi:hypothetical protein